MSDCETFDATKPDAVYIRRVRVGEIIPEEFKDIERQIRKMTGIEAVCKATEDMQDMQDAHAGLSLKGDSDISRKTFRAAADRLANYWADRLFRPKGLRKIVALSRMRISFTPPENRCKNPDGVQCDMTFTYGYAPRICRDWENLVRFAETE